MMIVALSASFTFWGEHKDDVGSYLSLSLTHTLFMPFFPFDRDLKILSNKLVRIDTYAMA
jgi:hypothetical protein